LGACLVLLAGLTLSACSSVPSTAEGVDKRIERIQHQDTGVRIQELRVGGQTESIDVQPSSGAPAYQVGPAQNTAKPPQEGRSFWRLFEF
jgi:starvation-inducible outer membrane lipoprotein